MDEIVWKGKPSQWIHFKIYLLCFLFCWLIIPVFYALYKFLEVKCTDIEINRETISIRTGILSKSTEDIDLFRIRDIELFEPFVYRWFGIGIVTLHTSDKTAGDYQLRGIHDPKGWISKLKVLVDARQESKRTREIDFVHDGLH